MFYHHGRIAIGRIGKYYTDRGHSGDMVFTKVDSNDGRKI